MYLDGPYGTPIQELMKVDHAVFVGGGVGVNPFASVLQHILNKKKSTSLRKDPNFKLKKVQRSFDLLVVFIAPEASTCLASHFCLCTSCHTCNVCVKNHKTIAG